MYRIDREDMMELTRRMTTARTSMTRIAGSYMDAEGYSDGTFNTHFLKLSLSERTKNLAIAKDIPFSETNEELKAYRFSKEARKPGGIWQLLMAMKSCGLKNDALMETFYELVGECYQADRDYAIFVFHDRYDVPVKAADHERLWESEEVYEYLICAICPLTGRFEPGKPEWGFLFPAFRERSGEEEFIHVFQRAGSKDHPELRKLLRIN